MLSQNDLGEWWLMQKNEEEKGKEMNFLDEELLKNFLQFIDSFEKKKIPKR